MNTVTVSKRSRSVYALLKKAQGQELRVRTEDGMEFIIKKADDADDEVVRTRKNKKLKAFLQDRARQPATISMEEIKKEFGLT